MEPVGLRPEGGGGPAKERGHRARGSRQDAGAAAGRRRERRRRGGEGGEAEAEAEEGRRRGEVREVDDVGRLLLLLVPALHELALVQVVAGLVGGAVEVVVERHEERVVCAELRVVQRVERRRVHQVFERREDVEEQLGHDLEVAVAEVVHEVDVDEVAVCYSHGGSAGAHHGEQRDGEQGEVHQLLRERVDHRCIQICMHAKKNLILYVHGCS